VIGARLVSTDDDIFLASTKGLSVRFTACDDVRAARWAGTPSASSDMRVREGDSLLGMDLVRPGLPPSSPSLTAVTPKGSVGRRVDPPWSRCSFVVITIKINA
jgi:Type IIA topoisomerase (DNA gyrase/topo II, topoisomerase IV), A subunit